MVSYFEVRCDFEVSRCLRGHSCEVSNGTVRERGELDSIEPIARD